MEEIAPAGEKRDEMVQKMRVCLNRLAALLDANGDAKEWVMGSIGPTFADLALGAILRWFKLVGDPEVWEVIATSNEGRWALHLDKVQPWTQTP